MHKDTVFVFFLSAAACVDVVLTQAKPFPRHNPFHVHLIFSQSQLNAQANNFITEQSWFDLTTQFTVIKSHTKMRPIATQFNRCCIQQSGRKFVLEKVYQIPFNTELWIVVGCLSPRLNNLPIPHVWKLNCFCLLDQQKMNRRVQGDYVLISKCAVRSIHGSRARVGKSSL